LPLARRTIAIGWILSSCCRFTKQRAASRGLEESHVTETFVVRAAVLLSGRFDFPGQLHHGGAGVVSQPKTERETNREMNGGPLARGYEELKARALFPAPC